MLKYLNVRTVLLTKTLKDARGLQPEREETEGEAVLPPRLNLRPGEEGGLADQHLQR